jgi:hypothetical protein
MNRYILIHRLRGPVLLLLAGVVELLHVWNVINCFWCVFFPLALIAFGVLLLAERMSLSTEGGYPPYSGAPYAGSPYTGSPNPSGVPATQAYPTGTSTSIVPAHSNDFDKDPDGGQS